MKVCSRCGEEKELDEFYNNKRSKDGKTASCKSCIKKCSEKYRIENSDYLSAYNRFKNEEWRYTHLDEYRKTEREKKAKLAYKEKRRERDRNHPGNWKASYYKRLAREQNADGEFTQDEWEELKDKYGHMCLCCIKEEPEIYLTIDHVIPLSKGGKNYISNIQPLCIDCNKKKFTKSTDYRVLFTIIE